MVFLTRKLFLVGAVLGLAAGCSTVKTPSPADPFEGFNRSVDTFNDAVDRAALKPLAKGYDAVVPSEIQMCIGNFFSNLGEFNNAINNLLQGKPKAAFKDMGRFALNTTVGIVGLVDVASEVGLTRSEEDFGQTLGVWGVPSGPYLVVPFLGPSTVRDTPTRYADAVTNLLYYDDQVGRRNSLFALELVHIRARLLPATDLVDRVALDRYSFVRDAYLSRRATLIRDGAADPNQGSDYDDFDDDEGAMRFTPADPLNGGLASLGLRANLAGQPSWDQVSYLAAPGELQASQRVLNTLKVVQ